MAGSMIGEIITDHRERMLNLKKYYPFSGSWTLHLTSIRMESTVRLIWVIFLWLFCVFY